MDVHFLSKTENRSIPSKKRGKEILQLRKHGFTLEEIGKKYGITRERVRQIEIINTDRKTTKFGIPLKQTKEYLLSHELTPISELKTFIKRKRESLGLADIKFNGEGGREFIRNIVRARDNYTCQKCKKVWEKNQRKFDVHHLDEAMLGRNRMKGVIKYDKENMDKLITFCHKCHYAWHKEAGHTKLWRKKLST